MARRTYGCAVGTVVLLLVLFGLGMIADRFGWWPRLPEKVDRPERALVPVEPPPGLIDDADPQSLAESLQQCVEQLDKRPDANRVFGPDRVEARQISAQLRAVLGWLGSGLSGRELVEELLRRYRLYESAAGPGRVLVTGYYEASLRGSRTRQGPYQTPLYRPPRDVIEVDLGLFGKEFEGKRLTGLLEGSRLVPMPDRAAIARGALAGRGLELLYVDDPVEAFFLEIQGSGRVQLDDGTTQSVGYAGKNGREYKPIGALLIREGKIPREKMSGDAIKAYLREHPEEQRRVFDYNPSVVFFGVRRGPEGSSGAIVIGGRSIATDNKLFPVCGLALLRTTRPVVDRAGERIGEEPLVRLVLNQDTGGAIRGPGRVDLFTGFGKEAEELASHMQNRGSLYFFSPLPPTRP